jgi:MFS family permease
MAQSIRGFVLELQPGSTDLLRAQIAAMTSEQEECPEQYAIIRAAIPQLHFLSLTIFPDAQYDPVLVIEANFDGAPGPFWARLEAAYGERLRDMLRCGKPPRDSRAALFRAVTRPGSRAPIAPMLEAFSYVPAVGHQGNRGLDRERIAGEGALFAAVQSELDERPSPADATAADIHRTLRQALLPRFPWLDMPALPRIPEEENRADMLRLVAFLAAVLLAGFAPGLLVSLLLPPGLAALLLLAAAVAIAASLGLIAPRALRGAASPPRGMAVTAVAALVLFAATGTVVCALLGALVDTMVGAEGAGFASHLRACAGHWACGLAGLPATVLGVAAWIRRLEDRDPAQDAPPQDQATLRAMARREDRIAQNHMGSVVHLKPGVLRAILIRAALLGLGLILRVQKASRAGFLGSMRTIHFAHWGYLSNGARLIFFSNFDGSWESYLDDFIEKAHGGLTLAWSSGVGFPPTRYLVLDGAVRGRAFKAWARHSMAESLFWFSAYPDFTVNQIERQARVAEGLRRPVLSDAEADAWTLDL